MHRITSTAVLCLAIAACSADNTPSALDAGNASFSRGQAQVSVCHHDSDGDSFDKITVAAPAVPAHLAHGDALPGDRLPDDSGVFGPECEPAPDAPVLQNLVTIDPPSSAAGVYEASHAVFGPPLTTTGVTGAVFLVDDGTGVRDACAPFASTSPNFGVAGIAVVDRGLCPFVQKEANVQAAGAIAMIVVKPSPDPRS